MGIDINPAKNFSMSAIFYNLKQRLIFVCFLHAIISEILIRIGDLS